MTFLDDLERRSHTAEGWAVTDAEKMRVLKLARLAEEAMSYIDCEVDDTDEVNDLHRLAYQEREVSDDGTGHGDIFGELADAAAEARRLARPAEDALPCPDLDAELCGHHNDPPPEGA
jgi:hypothetical protein